MKLYYTNGRIDLYNPLPKNAMCLREISTYVWPEFKCQCKLCQEEDK
jgi:hypothetical protein